MLQGGVGVGGGGGRDRDPLNLWIGDERLSTLRGLLDPSRMPKHPSIWRHNRQNPAASRNYDPPRAREGCTCTIVPEREYAIAFGGRSAGKHSSEVNKLDLRSLLWSSVEPTGHKGPDPRSKHSATLVRGGRAIWFYGGEGDFEGESCPETKRSARLVHNDLWALDTATFAWEPLQMMGSLPMRQVRYGCTKGRT